MSDDRKIDAKDAIRLALALAPTTVNETVIREVLSDCSVASLSQVAQAFGVAAATVRHTWRRDGMPGDAKAKCWPLAEILIWLLRRNKSNAEARGVDEFTRRKREAETKAVEAEARIKERKAQLVEGEHAPIKAMQSIIRGTLNRSRDVLMRIPQKWKARFPVKYATDWTGELEGDIRNGLTMIAETPVDDLLGWMDDESVQD